MQEEPAARDRRGDEDSRRHDEYRGGRREIDPADATRNDPAVLLSCILGKSEFVDYKELSPEDIEKLLKKTVTDGAGTVRVLLNKLSHKTHDVAGRAAATNDKFHCKPPEVKKTAVRHYAEAEDDFDDDEDDCENDNDHKNEDGAFEFLKEKFEKFSMPDIFDGLSFAPELPDAVVEDKAPAVKSAKPA